MMVTVPTPTRGRRKRAPRQSRYDRIVTAVWLVVLLGGAVAGAVLFERLASNLDPAPSAESMVARAELQRLTGDGDVVIALAPQKSSASMTASVTAMNAVPGVLRAQPAQPGAVLPGQGAALIITLEPGLATDAEHLAVTQIGSELRERTGGPVALGGYPPLDSALGVTAEADLVRAEAVALPIVLLLLALAVASWVGAAAGLALVLTTITGAMVLLLGLSYVTDVSSFAVNIVTMLGIGLAVDYGLLILTRFRAERGQGATVQDAVSTTSATAARTVLLSAGVVIIALTGLLAFAESSVRSLAYGGIGGVLVAALSATTLLPVILRRHGHRLRPLNTVRHRGWVTRLTAVVQRRPVLVAGLSLAALAVAASPLAGLRLTGLDERALPAGAEARSDAATIKQAMPTAGQIPITVLAAAPNDRTRDYAAAIKALPAVTTVIPRQGTPAGQTVLDILVDAPPASSTAMNAVRDIRAIDAPFNAKVTGLAAKDRDFIDSLLSRLPIVAAIVLLGTFTVLLLVTGGVLVSLKAILMNVASLAASLGVLVWAFQDAHLGSLLGVASIGGLELIIVVLTAVFAFGLATDYEMFLLAAVMAARRSGQATNGAVQTGLASTSRIISTAAALIVVVFIGFAAGDLLIVKQLGVGLAVAVIIDATIIRLALAPALMTLLAERNWAGPAFAQRISDRLWHAEHNPPADNNDGIR